MIGALLAPFTFCVSAGLAQDASQTDDPAFDVQVTKPSYKGRGPRVLFDEAHFNVHTTSGTYSAFAKLMASDGYELRPGKSAFDRRTLRGVNIVVIANALGAVNPDSPEAARPAFSEAECDLLRDWVRGGGRLLLITDHEPAASAAETLASRFNIGTSKNFTLDKENYFTRAGWPGNVVFSRSKGLLANHPIIDGRDPSERVNEILTFGGQSLKGPPASTALLKLSDSAKTLFAFPARQAEFSAAGRSIALSMQYGRGRIVMTGEAGMLSAQLLREGTAAQPFGMNVPGYDNRQLALNIMHWLSGLTG